ncbi:MAG: DHA2 family efflux MFS transporter permease subunit [Actinomycetota bacterium]|jgi:EmrB/QacA subfamily drug resistance transporter|nr:DHA2 family efflux MFS transporter permease subunit [Actinomycetota bacterium]
MTSLSGPGATPAQARAHARRWWTLGILSLSVVLVAIDNTIVNVTLPTLAHRVHASTSDLQWIVDAYTICFAGLLLVCGSIGDRVGRKRLLQAGLVLFMLTSFAAAHSGSLWPLVASRAGMGIAAALVYPSTLAMLPAIFASRKERAIAVGVWSGVSGVAIALGPVAGGFLLEHFWWGSIFMVNLPVAAIALILGAVFVRGSRDPVPGRFDLPAALLSVPVIGLTIWTIIEAPQHGWTSAQTLAGFAGSAVLLVAFVWWELRCENPMVDVHLFRNARFSVASTTISLAFFGLFGFTFIITEYFQLVRGYSPLKAGAATLPYAAVMAALSPLAMLIVVKIGTKVVASAGLVLMAAGFLIVVRAGVYADYWKVIVVSMCLMAAGMALSTGPATDSVLAALPEARAGVGSAFNDTTRELGGALGVAVSGSLLSWFYGSRLSTAWSALGVPAGVLGHAKTSVAAGLAIAGRAGPAAHGPALASAVRSSFMTGLHVGSAVIAGTMLVTAAAALALLPRRDRVQVEQPAEEPVTADA